MGLNTVTWSKQVQIWFNLGTGALDPTYYLNFWRFVQNIRFFFHIILYVDKKTRPGPIPYLVPVPSSHELFRKQRVPKQVRNHFQFHLPFSSTVQVLSLTRHQIKSTTAPPLQRRMLCFTSLKVWHFYELEVLALSCLHSPLKSNLEVIEWLNSYRRGTSTCRFAPYQQS